MYCFPVEKEEAQTGGEDVPGGGKTKGHGNYHGGTYGKGPLFSDQSLDAGQLTAQNKFGARSVPA